MAAQERLSEDNPHDNPFGFDGNLERSTYLTWRILRKVEKDKPTGRNGQSNRQKPTEKPLQQR